MWRAVVVIEREFEDDTSDEEVVEWFSSFHAVADDVDRRYVGVKGVADAVMDALGDPFPPRHAG